MSLLVSFLLFISAAVLVCGLVALVELWSAPVMPDDKWGN